MVDIINGSEAIASNVPLSSRQVEAARPQEAPNVVENNVEAQIVETQPPFVSPRIRLDFAAQQVVLELRDSQSGEVTDSITTSEAAADAYRQLLDETTQQQSSNVTAPSATDNAVASEEGSLTTSTQQEVEQIEVSEPDTTPSSQLLNDGDTSSFA